MKTGGKLKPIPAAQKTIDLSEREELREALFLALCKVPSEEDLKAGGMIANKTDRERVRRRRMLEVVHGFVLNNLLPDPHPDTDEDGSIFVDLSNEPMIAAFEMLASAIRDFSGDIKRLDLGLGAITVLHRVNVEPPSRGSEPVSPQRKVLLLALMFMNCRPTGTSLAEQRRLASKHSNYTEGSLHTSQQNLNASMKAHRKNPGSNWTNGKRPTFTEAECQAYLEMEETFMTLVGRGRRGEIPSLIEPVLVGLASGLKEAKPLPGPKAKPRAKR